MLTTNGAIHVKFVIASSLS